MIPFLLIVIICILCPIFIPAIAVLFGSYLGLFMIVSGLILVILFARIISSFVHEAKKPITEQQKQNESDWNQN